MERSDDAPARTENNEEVPGNTPDLPSVAEALAACVREALERGGQAEVPGLGTFRVEHHASEMKEPSEGQLSMTPPRDDVVFEPAREPNGTPPPSDA